MACAAYHSGSKSIERLIFWTSRTHRIVIAAEKSITASGSHFRSRVSTSNRPVWASRASRESKRKPHSRAPAQFGKKRGTSRRRRVHLVRSLALVSSTRRTDAAGAPSAARTQPSMEILPVSSRSGIMLMENRNRSATRFQIEVWNASICTRPRLENAHSFRTAHSFSRKRRGFASRVAAAESMRRIAASMTAICVCAVFSFPSRSAAWAAPALPVAETASSAGEGECARMLESDTPSSSRGGASLSTSFKSRSHTCAGLLDGQRFHENPHRSRIHAVWKAVLHRKHPVAADLNLQVTRFACSHIPGDLQLPHK